MTCSRGSSKAVLRDPANYPNLRTIQKHAIKKANKFNIA